MANYVFKDKERTKIVYANDCLRDPRGIRYYCPNPLCDAEMYLCATHGNTNAYFRATKPGHSHIKPCSYSSVRELELSLFDESKFIFDTALKNLFKQSKKILSTKKENNTLKLDKVLKKPPHTIKQIYSICKNFDINEKYGDTAILDMILDNRTSYRYPKGCYGFKIIEAIPGKIIYDNQRQEIYLKSPISEKKFTFVLKFQNRVLYQQIRDIIFNNCDRIVIVASDWVSAKQFNWFEGKITSLKQVTIQ